MIFKMRRRAKRFPSTHEQKLPKLIASCKTVSKVQIQIFNELLEVETSLLKPRISPLQKSPSPATTKA
jgi:hypothetical protein